MPQNRKEIVSIKAETTFHTSGSLQIDCDNPGDTIKVKDKIKVWKEIHPAKK